MKMRVWLLVTVLAGGMMANSPARGTTMVSLSLRQLTLAASDIVQGQVASQVTTWNSNHTQILTITTFAVTQAIKGNASSRVEIEQLGGNMGNMHVYIPGDVVFQPQTEYVLFLEPMPTGSRYRVVGMTQGAYPVYQDASTHEERVVVPAYSHLVGEIQAISAANPAGTLPLESFHKYVATLATAPVQIPHGLALSVAIISTEADGVGRLHVYGKTTMNLFPNKNLVIPAGTEVEGEAHLSSSTWTITWDEMNVRGVHAQIAATNQEPEGSLRGRSLVLKVR